MLVLTLDLYIPPLYHNDLQLHIPIFVIALLFFSNFISLWIAIILDIKFFFQALGPTYSKIIANQFARLRKGDRFFYEDDTDENVRLRPAELREIKKTTLALIFCNNLNANNEPLGNYSSNFLISIYLL